MEVVVMVAQKAHETECIGAGLLLCSAPLFLIPLKKKTHTRATAI
jgi:hypothetical protein